MYLSIFDAKVELLQAYFRYTLNILHLTTDIIIKMVVLNCSNISQCNSFYYIFI